MNETVHSHNFADKWSFADSEDTVAICCVHVLNRERSVHFVTHDEVDGDWQFLCGEPHDGNDGRVVCLGCMVERDQTLLALADLPRGWGADRSAVGAPWNYEPNRIES